MLLRSLRLNTSILFRNSNLVSRSYLLDFISLHLARDVKILESLRAFHSTGNDPKFLDLLNSSSMHPTMPDSE